MSVFLILHVVLYGYLHCNTPGTCPCEDGVGDPRSCVGRDTKCHFFPVMYFPPEKKSM